MMPDNVFTGKKPQYQLQQKGTHLSYRKTLKILKPRNTEHCNYTKIWTVICPKYADGMTNSVDPDQTAPLGAVWSGSTLFAQTCPSENFRLRVATVWAADRYRWELYQIIPHLVSLSARASSSEFVSSSIPSWQIFYCACPAIQRGQGFGFLSEGSSSLTACMSEQRRFWRDCADAQARLNLRCSHRR